MDEVNRDLLMILLATLTEEVPRTELSEALADWARDPRRSLPEILMGRGAVDPGRVRSLVERSDSSLDQYRGDLRACVEGWRALGATQEFGTEVADPGLQPTVAAGPGLEETLPSDSVALRTVDDVASSDPDATVVLPGGGAGAHGPGTGPEGPDRFRPIRLYARGGIGQVWVARDVELQREVALKVIQERFAGHADQQARFLLEAEVTGKLEHPGIVPVYSLGRDAEGRPYYAMRFIRGRSLAAEIREFHLKWRGGGPRPGAWAGVAFRELLGRFLDVCDTIAYAHSRGVLHRDLKPANIMLGRYGETLVVDWGLAKVIDRPDIVPAPVEGEPTLTAGGSREDSGETQPGTTIGTPSYMSPEQARGAIDEMGPTSDVYSLGVTLFEVLTGQVAFPGERTSEVIERVLKGEFRPPRSLVRSVPPALEAICLKAMARGRRDRYPTVRELAQDLRHWLADEPVSAYREGRLERLFRWLRRHRTWTFAAAAALLGITVAATIGVVVVERGRQREAEARTLAERNYNLARKAVEDYFTRVSQDTLLKYQDSVDMRRLRSELLRMPLEYFREFLQQRSGDPAVRRDLAEARFRVGEIEREIGERPDQAVAAFEGAIALWDDLLRESPEDPDLRFWLARTCLALGDQHAWRRDFRPALDALNRSRVILTALHEERPDDATYRLRLADCDRVLGIAEGEMGAFERGLEHLKQAESLLREYLRGRPGDADFRKCLAATVNGEGFILSRQVRDVEALRAFQEYQEICRSLLEEVRSGPVPVDLLVQLAKSYYNVGAIQYERDPARVLENFEKALEYRTKLAEAHPSVNDFREKMAQSLEEVAPYRHQAGQDAEAFAAIREAIAIFEKLVDSQPDQPRYRAELGRGLNILGYLQDEGRHNAEAKATLERALREVEEASADSPETELYRVWIVDILRNLGEQSMDLGRVEEGLPHYRRAVAIRRELLDANPGDRNHILDLADQIAMLAGYERHGGDPEASERSFAEAVAVLESLPGDGADPEVQGRLGASLTGQGRSASDRGRDDRARPILRRAVAVLSPAGASATDDPVPRERLTEALWEAARVARCSGHPDEADLLDAERLALWRDRPPVGLIALALKETARAALIGYGTIPVGERAAAVRRQDLDLAAENVRMAVALGYRDLDALRKDSDARLLLDHDGVQSLLFDMGFPDDPFAEAEGAR